MLTAEMIPVEEFVVVSSETGDGSELAVVVELIVLIVHLPTQLHPAYTPTPLAANFPQPEIGPNLTNNWFYPPTSGGQKFH